MSVMFLPLRLIPVPVQCVVLSTVLELFFSRDKSLAPLLTALNDKVFRIHVRDTNAVIFLGFKQGRPWVHPNHQGEVDVKLNATTTAFARLCFAHEDPDELVFEQVLKLSGDSEAMLRFKKLLAAADLDWERELRSAFGDFFGQRVASAAHALVATEQKVAATAQQILEERLKRMEMPGGERTQAWQAGVEDLQRRISRLKGRITRAEHRAGTRDPL
ncbi:MAG: SCP2 sterol-binding domain-containing protein [Mariprofundaceae bacterium]|nr:SCP2 sterol-binding domain-containing protein [Mariprofundaceae bacterium]